MSRAALKPVATERLLWRDLLVARQRIREMEDLADLQHSRYGDATRLWQEAHPGNDHVWPDLGELIGWLIERGNP